jgi:hypothetical protein
MNSLLRSDLVSIALRWEQRFGNAPSITTVLSEYDAAMLVGMSEDQYAASMQGATSVQQGYDFKFNGHRFQVKGNRPSGKPGSNVTWVPKATNYDWDHLIWILYDPGFQIVEAWQWDVSSYKTQFHEVKRLSPAHHRQGKCLAQAR